MEARTDRAAGLDRAMTDEEKAASVVEGLAEETYRPCPQCKAKSLSDSWLVDYDAFYCEECRNPHGGIKCPNCGHAFDRILLDFPTFL